MPARFALERQQWKQAAELTIARRLFPIQKPLLGSPEVWGRAFGASLPCIRVGRRVTADPTGLVEGKRKLLGKTGANSGARGPSMGSVAEKKMKTRCVK